MKRSSIFTVFAASAVSLTLMTCVAGAEPVFEGGDGTIDNPWQIATAEQLDLVREDLGAHYILTGDIDLAGYDNWEPIGTFQSLSDAPEDAEVPHPDYAFTGTFDGDGHIISNLTVNCEAPWVSSLHALFD